MIRIVLQESMSQMRLNFLCTNTFLITIYQYVFIHLLSVNVKILNKMAF